MLQGFEDRAVVGDWEDAREILGEEANMVALEDNGVIKEGDFAMVDHDPGIEGIYLDRGMVSPDEVSESERVIEGFYSLNSNGDPVELKYRFPDELREYPEQLHVHNVPELYVPTGGEFVMSLASVTDDGYPLKFEEITLDEPFVVPAGMYHGIQEREETAGLGVARGDPYHKEDTVGKWDIKGDQQYDHATNIDFPTLTEYKEEDYEMYRL